MTTPGAFARLVVVSASLCWGCASVTSGTDVAIDVSAADIVTTADAFDAVRADEGSTLDAADTTSTDARDCGDAFRRVECPPECWDIDGAACCVYEGTPWVYHQCGRGECCVSLCIVATDCPPRWLVPRPRDP